MPSSRGRSAFTVAQAFLPAASRFVSTFFFARGKGNLDTNVETAGRNACATGLIRIVPSDQAESRKNATAITATGPRNTVVKTSPTTIASHANSHGARISRAVATPV